jgi:hypothetical protein
MVVIKYSSRFLRVDTNHGEIRIKYFPIISKDSPIFGRLLSRNKYKTNILTDVVVAEAVAVAEAEAETVAVVLKI